MGFLSCLFGHPPSTSFLFDVATKQDLADLGLFGRAVVTGETLWESLQTAKTHIPYLQSDLSLAIRIRSGRCRVEVSHKVASPHAQPQSPTYMVGLLANLVQNETEVAARNFIVGFPGAEDEDSSDFAELCKPVTANLAFVEFDDIGLKSPMKQADFGNSLILARTLEALSKSADPSPDLARLVQAVLIASFEQTQNPIKLKSAADVLGIPLRTFQDRLNKEHTTFAEIRSKVRHKLACAYLLDGLSIEQTATSLGYAHRQSFSEAFRKWEGMPPSSFKDQGVIGDRMLT